MTSIAPARSDEARRDELAERVFGAVGGAMDLLVIYLGDRLGLYRSLADDGSATAPELAARTGIAPRYAREWLEHQAVAGFVDVDDVAAEADTRRYALPAGHAEVLLDDDSLAHVAPLARFIVGAAQTMPRILEAFRSGGGVDWAEYGPDVIEAQEAANRPQFAAFVGDWIEALPDIAGRLRSGGRVADLACGTGWSSISIARQFPGVHIDGVDVDESSIARARAHAGEAEMTDRVAFLHADAAASEGGGTYDLVTIFEAVHDMPNPVEVLGTARKLLKPGGAVLVADELTAEQFTAPGDDMEKLYYAYSVTCCLPAGMTTPDSAATGTVMRPATLERYVREAGFGGFAILPIEHEAFRFYRLDP
jgi:ubiquinone/menaquinone biosynthesis C-methylase UbiE